MKRFLLSIATICIVLFAFSVFSIAAQAAQTFVIDDAGLLNDADKASIAANVSDCGYDVYLYLPKTSTLDDEEDIDRYTEAMMRKRGIDSKSDVIILAVYRTDTWHYLLYTYGEANDAISNKEVNAILDASAVYQNLKGGRIAPGFVAFTKELVHSCEPAPKWHAIVSCLVVGLVCGGAAVTVVVLCYRMKIKKTNYPLEKYASLSLTDKDDFFTGTTVTRRKIPSSSSKGKSGGSGGRRGGR